MKKKDMMLKESGLLSYQHAKSALSVLALAAIVLLAASTPSAAKDYKILGEHEIVSGMTGQHTKGKVKLFVFMDFFCPHCHEFDTVTASLLKTQFADLIEIDYIGIPILGNESKPAIAAYELAKDYGKGDAMREAIFDAIHYDNARAENMDVLLQIATNVGLPADKIKKSLAAGEKDDVLQANQDLAKRYSVRGTPTVIINGNIKSLNNSHGNIEKIINSLLANETK